MPDINKPLDGEEVVIHVPKGTSQFIKLVEEGDVQLPSQITVRVSRNRISSKLPVLGVVVK